MSIFRGETTMRVDAITITRPAALTERVAFWLQAIEAIEARRVGSLALAREKVAEATKIAPGTLERIRRRRVKDVRGSVLARIGRLFAESARSEIARLEDELAIALALGLDQDSRQAVKAFATLVDSRAAEADRP